MTIHYLAELSDLTGKSSETLPPAASLQDCLQLLVKRYGHAMQQKLFTPDGDLACDLLVLINGRHARHLGGLAATLSEADQISLIPLIEGG